MNERQYEGERKRHFLCARKEIENCECERERKIYLSEERKREVERSIVRVSRNSKEIFAFSVRLEFYK